MGPDGNGAHHSPKNNTWGNVPSSRCCHSSSYILVSHKFQNPSLQPLLRTPGERYHHFLLPKKPGKHSRHHQIPPNTPPTPDESRKSTRNFDRSAAVKRCFCSPHRASCQKSLIFRTRTLQPHTRTWMQEKTGVKRAVFEHRHLEHTGQNTSPPIDDPMCSVAFVPPHAPPGTGHDHAARLSDARHRATRCVRTSTYAS